MLEPQHGLFAEDAAVHRIAQNTGVLHRLQHLVQLVQIGLPLGVGQDLRLAVAHPPANVVHQQGLNVGHHLAV